MLFNIRRILLCYYLYHHSPLKIQGRDKYITVLSAIIYEQRNSINHTIFIVEKKVLLFSLVSFSQKVINYISWNIGQHFYTSGASIYKQSEKNVSFSRTRRCQTSFGLAGQTLDISSVQIGIQVRQSKFYIKTFVFCALLIKRNFPFSNWLNYCYN